MFNNPPKPVHIPGTRKGEEVVRQEGHEPGRNKSKRSYRTARDSTGLNPDQLDPIDPRMPHIPPA